MTTFEKIISVIFSVIILIISVLYMLTLGGTLDINWGTDFISKIIENDVLSKVFLGIFIILAILAIKEIFFGKKVSNEGREGIVLENETGKLIISKESLENLIAGVGRDIPGTESISSKTFIDIEKNVTVNINVVIGREVVIKDISTQLQKKVKEALKQTADLDVKYVNIKIKNIANKKSKKNEEKGIETNKNNVKEV